MTRLNGNIYYRPEGDDMSIVGAVDLREPCYSFDLLVVWKKGNKYYVGQDSGCSCPAPFENVYALDDLDGPFTKAGVCKFLADFKADGYYSENYYRPQIVDLIARIRSAG